MTDYTFEHVHLVSDNPDKTAEFYVKYLGAKTDSVVTTPSGKKAVRIRLNEALIIISPSRDGSDFRGLEHFGLVTGDMAASISELSQAGCVFQGGPVKVTPGTTIAFFKTPEEVLIELVEYRSSR